MAITANTKSAVEVSAALFLKPRNIRNFFWGSHVGSVPTVFGGASEMGKKPLDKFPSDSKANADMSNDPSLEILEEFGRLFWLSRRTQSNAREKQDRSFKEVEECIAYSEKNNLIWGDSLVLAGDYQLIRNESEALRILNEIGGKIPDKIRGLWLYLKAAAFAGINETKAAIEIYIEALENPLYGGLDYVKVNLAVAYRLVNNLPESISILKEITENNLSAAQGIAQIQLGLACEQKKEYKEAISLYQKAIINPTSFHVGWAYEALGRLLSKIKKHAASIAVLKKAIADPKNDRKAQAWHHLGLCYHEKKDYTSAIEAYQNALGLNEYSLKSYTLLNLGIAYTVIDETSKAIKRFEELCALDGASISQVANATRRMRAIELRIKESALSPNDLALEGISTSFEEEIEQFMITAISEAGESQYEKYLQKTPSELDNAFCVLRGWSSAVTLLEGSERLWRGGGYFIKWRGYGIVIDPGFDFLRNFHDAGFHGSEIDLVFVSHNHPDHNYDLKSIDDLKYELFMRSDQKPYVLLIDEGTNAESKFAISKPAHRHQTIVMNSGFPLPFDLQKHPSEIPLIIKPFNVRHGIPHALGAVFGLVGSQGNIDFQIGYSGDTEYFDGLVADLNNCELCLIHISQPDKQELVDSTKTKSNHLGYRGAINLVQKLNPHLCLVGEFWAGFTDMRIPIVKGLRQRSGVSTILPAGIGLVIGLPNMSVRCSQCDKMIPNSEIKISPPSDSFGNLAYLCSNCLL